MNTTPTKSLTSDRGETAPESYEPLRIERSEEGVARLWLDLPDRSVNTLRPDLAPPLEAVLEELERDDAVRAVVLASAKSDSFVVGADIELLRGITSREEGIELARKAQQIMGRLETFPKPLVAAIHGDCLGGGLEMALACDARIATDAKSTRLGLPEVQLGLLPGGGGTQRLPRLVGLEEAVQLILTGRRIPASRARKIGLVDEVVHPAILLSVATKRARQLAESRRRSRSGSRTDLKALLLEHNPLGRRLLFSQAEKKAREKTGDHMPGPLAALEVIRIGLEEGIEEGLAAEARAFGRLATTPQAAALIDLFLWRSELGKESGLEDSNREAPERVEPLEVRKVGVIGAGLMGAGIARVTAENAHLPVRLKDVGHQPLRAGMRELQKGLEREVERGRLDEQEALRIRSRVRPTLDDTGFGRADVVIEAVVENLETKRAVLREVEEKAADGAIFASNTSSLPIASIAEKSKRPERVLGMHYFSPVEKVPLLEVVVTDETAPEVIETCVKLGQRQGKTVIVVGDGTGFYTTRILGPFLNEATWILGEGAPVEEIDAALTRFGFPVGPLKLLDEVGIDVGTEIATILHEAYGERMKPSEAQLALAGSQQERKGRKNGCGFYRYRKGKDGYERSGGVDRSVYRMLEVEPDAEAVPRTEIARRCVLAMANEAVRCLDEGIVRSVRDAEVGAVFGLGFPPFLGGPLRWIDSRGAELVLRDLAGLAERFGARFEPAELLERTVRDGGTFHQTPSRN